MKSLATLLVAGIAGVAVLKILGLLLLPFVGAALGFVGLVVKWTLLAALVWFGWSLLRRRRRTRAAT